MKFLVFALALLLAPFSFASDYSQDFCKQESDKHFGLLHDLFVQTTEFAYYSIKVVEEPKAYKVIDLDLVEETYNYLIVTETTKGAVGVWKYTVKIRAWLTGSKDPVANCSLQGVSYERAEAYYLSQFR